MKRTFTLFIVLVLWIGTKAQVVLNEIYPIPGNGRQEFFELYNSNTGAVPVAMDNFTIITYFEEPGSKKGFYVMDLPNLNLPSQSYFVGAAATPFNYQGVNNCTTAQFSWNNVNFLSSNNGYLKKWLMKNDIPASVDGNDYYDQESLPVYFNDFFQKLGGGNASYVVFLYHNGVLTNTFLGATGGAGSIPATILSMPPLFVDMSGSVTDFQVNFSGYGSIPFESVVQEVGTDNGYIRRRDGYCGAWTKSSADANHTPGFTNGGSYDAPPTISVAAVINPGNATNGSQIIYDVVGAPASSFPVSMSIYVDNGTQAGALDAGDTFITTNTENTIGEGPFFTTFFPHNGHILIVVRPSAGCIDRVLVITNTGILPVKLKNFSGTIKSGMADLKWTVESNEMITFLEVQASHDGTTFSNIHQLTGTFKAGSQDYQYRFPAAGTGRYYRIALKELSGKYIYSSSVFINSTGTDELLIQSTLTENNLRFRYHSTEGTEAAIRIYTASGVKIHTSSLQVRNGHNQIIVPLEKTLAAGIYVVEIVTRNNRQAARFVKR